MLRSAPLLMLALVGCSLGWALGCGPSVQSIHEGTVRFEHCYRLDLDRSISPNHRLACWREWIDVYANGQTRDRVEYARRRVRYLGAGHHGTLQLALEGAGEPAGDPGAHEAAAAPTSAHAPPPAVATVRDAGPPAPVEAIAAAADAGALVDAAGPPADAGAVPFADCLARCSSTWETCGRQCSDEPGTRGRTCSGCLPNYRRCVRRCVE